MNVVHLKKVSCASCEKNCTIYPALCKELSLFHKLKFSNPNI